MATIYISYQHLDSILVQKIAGELAKRGHSILMDQNVLNVGQDWRKVLLESIRDADGILVLISEKSLLSNYVVSEIGTARAYVAESLNNKFLIPIIYGDIPIPNFIEDLYCIRLNEDNFSDSINKVDASISGFIGRREAEKEKANEQRLTLESKAADYINDATLALKKRETQNTAVAFLCYALGLSTLICGIIFSINGLDKLTSIINFENSSLGFITNSIQIWFLYIFLILKSIIVIGLLIACSKYTFTLGKSFMHEALRNADRRHAISFGEFVLKAYGEKINTVVEIREVFEEWNIDKPSAFSNIDASSYDPKFYEKLIESIKTLSDKV